MLDCLPKGKMTLSPGQPPQTSIRPPSSVNVFNHRRDLAKALVRESPQITLLLCTLSPASCSSCTQTVTSIASTAST